MSSIPGRYCVVEDSAIVFEQADDNLLLVFHVRKLASGIRGTHEGRREHDGKVSHRHLINVRMVKVTMEEMTNKVDVGMLDYSAQMEHQELKASIMGLRKLVHTVLHCFDLFGWGAKFFKSD